MFLRPRWKHCKMIIYNDAVLLPLAIGYLALLIQSWTPQSLQLIMPGSFRAGFAGA